MIELVVAVAIVAVLAAIAVPSYYGMIEAVHRSEAKGLLGDLYGTENAFFAESQRFGCLDEVGFQLEGRGHMAVWICADLSGCYFDPAKRVTVCPCMESPADWTGDGGDPFTRADFAPPSWRFGAIPAPGAPGLLAAGPPVLAIPMPGPSSTAWSPMPTPSGAIGGCNGPCNPGDPAGLPPVLSLPADCPAFIDSHELTAGADNWCRRAIPEVIDVFWETSQTGKNVFWVPFEDSPAHMDSCTPGPGSGGGTGGSGGTPPFGGGGGPPMPGG